MIARLIFAARTQSRHVRSTHWHQHEHWQIEWIQNHTVEFLSSNQPKPSLLQRHSIAIIPPGHKHCFRYRQSGSSWWTFRLEMIVEELRFAEQAKVFPPSATLQLRSQLENVLGHHQTVTSPLLKEKVANILVGYILDAMPLEHMIATRGDQIRQFISQELARRQYRRLSVAELARAYGCSAPYFSNLCCREAGSAPKTLIDQCLSEHYSHYLRYTEIPIQELAFNFGFPSSEEFSRYIRRTCGLSPRALRKSNFSTSGDLPKREF